MESCKQTAANSGLRTETIMIDGCTVLLKYSDTSNPAVMHHIKDTLFHQFLTPLKSVEICNILADVR